jgi:hypothetical protein
MCSLGATNPNQLFVCGLRCWLPCAGVGALEPEQLQKIEAEASVIAEIQQLGGEV